jgi:hypothetical protein
MGDVETDQAEVEAIRFDRSYLPTADLEFVVLSDLHSADIWAELGCSHDEIDALARAGAVRLATGLTR